MYTEAFEYLQPIHRFARYCGVFPTASVRNQSVSYLYSLYQFILLVLATPMEINSIVTYNYYFKDIVLFTTTLAAVTRLLFHMSALLLPLALKHTYSTLMTKISRIQYLLHSININQKETPSKLKQCLFIIIATVAPISFGIAVYIQLHAPVHLAVGACIYYFTLQATILQVLSVLILLNDKFSLINWHLDFLNNKTPFHLSYREKRLFIEKKMCQKNLANNFVNSTLEIKEMSAHKIKTLNQIHFVLITCFNLINRYISLQILFCLFRSALEVITISIIVFDSRNKYTCFQISYITINVLCMYWMFLLANLCYKIKAKVRFA